MLSVPRRLDGIPNIQLDKVSPNAGVSCTEMLNTDAFTRNTLGDCCEAEAIVGEILAVEVSAAEAAKSLCQVYIRLAKDHNLIASTLLDIAIEQVDKSTNSDPSSKSISIRVLVEVSNSLRNAGLDTQKLGEPLKKLISDMSEDDLQELIALVDLPGVLALAGELEAAFSLLESNELDPLPFTGSHGDRVRIDAIQGLSVRGSIDEAMQILADISDPGGRITAQISIAESESCSSVVAKELLDQALKIAETEIAFPTPHITENLRAFCQLQIARCMHKKGFDFSEAVRAAVFSTICSRMPSRIRESETLLLLDSAGFSAERDRILAMKDPSDRFSDLMEIARERLIEKRDVSDIFPMALTAYNELREHKKSLARSRSSSLAELALEAGDIAGAQKILRETPPNSVGDSFAVGKMLGKLAYVFFAAGRKDEANEILNFAKGEFMRSSAYASFSAQVAVKSGLAMGLASLARLAPEKIGTSFGLIDMATALAEQGMISSALMVADQVSEYDKNFGFAERIIWPEALVYTLVKRATTH